MISNAYSLFKDNLIRIVLFLFTVYYWNFYLGWKLATLLISMICIHEYGHLYQMKKYGISTKGIYLTPFGGIALADNVGRTYWQEVIISIMGPIWGLAYAFMFALLYSITGNSFFGGCAFYIALIHLFNFLPINPLDGGRVAKAIAISIHPILAIILLSASLLFCLWLFLVSFNFIFIFIAFLGLMELGTIALYLSYKRDPAKFLNASPEVKYHIKQLESMKYLNGKEKFLTFFYYIGLCVVTVFLILAFTEVAYRHQDFIRFFN